MIELLEPAQSTSDPEPFAGPDHPMRVLTREIAFGGQWTPRHAKFVQKVFNELASDWSANACGSCEASSNRRRIWAHRSADRRKMA